MSFLHRNPLIAQVNFLETLICAVTILTLPSPLPLPLPPGAMLLTAGGNEIKVWDILSGGRLMHTFSNHQKNITG